MTDEGDRQLRADRDLLVALLGQDKLPGRERAAFEDMLAKLHDPEGPPSTGMRRFHRLTDKQREYAHGVSEGLGLADLTVADEAANLWSAGKVPVGIKPREERHYEQAALPLSPPGRGAMKFKERK